MFRAAGTSTCSADFYNDQYLGNDFLSNTTGEDSKIKNKIAYKTKCDLFTLKFAAVIVKFVAMQIES